MVTTGTFGPMCSSGAIINTGHSKPRIKMKKAWFNDVEAYCGLAAVDCYLGATELPESDPENRVYPGAFSYGGAHVIQELVAGKEVRLRAIGYGTDCYPRKEIETTISLKTVNEAYLFNPRNCYQNYNCAVNVSDRMIYTYMGVLKPEHRQRQLLQRRAALAAAQGPALPHDRGRDAHLPRRRRRVRRRPGDAAQPGGAAHGRSGCPTGGRGDARRHRRSQADVARSLSSASSFMGYGVSLAVGLGVPIPILDEQMARFTAVKDEDIQTQIYDYSMDYPGGGEMKSLGEVTYKELRSGRIVLNGKEVATASMSSYYRARQIAETLKTWIEKKEFVLGEPQMLLPSVSPEPPEGRRKR